MNNNAQPEPTSEPTPDWVSDHNQVKVETHYETGSLRVTASNFSDLERAGQMVKAVLKADNLRALAGKL